MAVQASSAQVAASGEERSSDGIRLPAGEVHAWLAGANQTLCGIPLHRAGLHRFPGVRWADVDPVTGGAADAVRRVCPRCAAATGRRRDEHRSWKRRSPRP